MFRDRVPPPPPPPPKDMENYYPTRASETDYRDDLAARTDPAVVAANIKVIAAHQELADAEARVQRLEEALAAARREAHEAYCSVRHGLATKRMGLQ